MTTLMIWIINAKPKGTILDELEACFPDADYFTALLDLEANPFNSIEDSAEHLDESLEDIVEKLKLTVGRKCRSLKQDFGYHIDAKLERLQKQT